MYYYRPEKQDKGKSPKKPKRPYKPPRSTKQRKKTKPAPVLSKRKPNKGKLQTPPKKRRRHILLKAFLGLILLIALSLTALYFIPVGTFGNQTAPGATQALESGFTHVLLIGIDTNADNTSRSDTMMILSVGKGRAVLTSLQRDTGVYIRGRSALTRLNAAYNYGGAELLLDTINRNFGFDISLYMLVDYDSFPELIDLLGGVDIQGIKDSEIEQLNHNVRDVLRRRYNRGELTWDEITLIYMGEELTSGGDLHLDGLQALGYARIRKTDSDYMRTSRQRQILSAALKQLKHSDPITLIRFAVKGINCIETNMNLLQLMSLGEKALLAGSIEQMRLPANGTYVDEGSMFYNVDYQKNREIFIEYIYEK